MRRPAVEGGHALPAVSPDRDRVTESAADFRMIDQLKSAARLEMRVVDVLFKISDGIVRYERRKQDHTSPSPIECCLVISQGSAAGHEGSTCGHIAANLRSLEYFPPRREAHSPASTPQGGVLCYSTGLERT